MTVSRDDVIAALRTVYDPEIPVNIWDLGLVYNIDISEAEVVITMTFTSPTCPMMEELLEILEDLCPDVDFETEEHLIDHGLLESLDIVVLVGEIGQHFDVSVPVEELLPENFNSAAAILNLIRRLQEE